MGAAVFDIQYGNSARSAGDMPDELMGRRGHGGLAVSIFSDRAYLRAELADDAVAAGLRILQTGGLDCLDSGPVLADIVLLDCPLAEDCVQFDLAQFGQRAARCGVQLVVSTSMEALDQVFGCLDHGSAQILVAPNRAERMIALGRALPLAANRVQELSEIDRIALLRLTEQVSQIAQQLGQLSGTPGNASGPVACPPSDAGPEIGAVFRFDGRAEQVCERHVRTARPPLPDPRLVRRIVRHRQLRARYFDGELFADPAWDILLDLTAARAEHTRVSVSSLCIAAGVPTSTALRWIGQLIDSGLLRRNEDEADRRRAFITLTDKAADAIARYFAEMGPAASGLL